MERVQYIIYDTVMAILCLSLIILSVTLYVFCKKKNDKLEETVPKIHCATSYPLAEIDVATDMFNPRRIIGKGRIGTVYSAVLPRGELVAVKRVHPKLVYTNAGLGFSPMLKWISLANHPNIVPIVGFSEAPGERIVVTEFVGMMNLEFYLQQDCDSLALLDWGPRLKIAVGVARGLEYLHEVMSPPIVHGCIKPSNILVDAKFCARVCDYGLSFLSPHYDRRGLEGYVDDEYWSEKRGASKECDMYGFGVILLELLSGRCCESGLLVGWALPLIREMRFSEFLDHRLLITIYFKPLVRLAKVALACVGNCRENRPNIVQVASILNSLDMELCASDNSILLVFVNYF